jgi:hypothetical protein
MYLLVATTNKYDFFPKHDYNKCTQNYNLKFEWENAIFCSMCGWLEMIWFLIKKSVTLLFTSYFQGDLLDTVLIHMFQKEAGRFKIGMLNNGDYDNIDFC